MFFLLQFVLGVGTPLSAIISERASPVAPLISEYGIGTFPGVSISVTFADAAMGLELDAAMGLKLRWFISVVATTSPVDLGRLGPPSKWLRTPLKSPILGGNLGLFDPPNPHLAYPTHLCFLFLRWTYDHSILNKSLQENNFKLLFPPVGVCKYQVSKGVRKVPTFPLKSGF